MLSNILVWTALCLSVFAGDDKSEGDRVTYNCVGEDACKDEKVVCAAAETCIVNCDGKSSCGGNTVVDGRAAQQVAFNCVGEDACKGNTELMCGSGLCYLSCMGEDTVCEDTTVILGDATDFRCEGYCDDGSYIPAPFEAPTKQPSKEPAECDKECTDGQVCVDGECKQDKEECVDGTCFDGKCVDGVCVDTTTTTTPSPTEADATECTNNCPTGTICVEDGNGSFECREDPNNNDAGAAPAAVNGEGGDDAVYDHKETSSWLEANEVTVAAIAAVGLVLVAALGVCAYRVCKKGRKSHVGVALDDEEEEESEEETQMVEVVGLTN